MSWEERFNARFPDWSVNHYRELLIKDFIRSEIAEAEKRGAKQALEELGLIEYPKASDKT